MRRQEIRLPLKNAPSYSAMWVAALVVVVIYWVSVVSIASTPNLARRRIAGHPIVLDVKLDR